VVVEGTLLVRGLELCRDSLGVVMGVYAVDVYVDGYVDGCF
jgi:hypothetical protein